MLYDNAIGRNANFRNDDYSSVWKYRNPKEYIDRLSLPDGDGVIKKIEDDFRLFPLMVHNGLINANLWFFMETIDYRVTLVTNAVPFI